MKGNSYTSKLRLGALHCPVREFCPLAFLCAKPFDGDRLLLPNIVTVGLPRDVLDGFVCPASGVRVRRGCSERPDQQFGCSCGARVARASFHEPATCAHGQKLTLAHQRARDKVASVLLRLEAALLRDPAFGGTVPLSYDDIAFLACTERATTSRELKAFAHDGLIDLSYRRIALSRACTSITVILSRRTCLSTMKPDRISQGMMERNDPGFH